MFLSDVQIGLGATDFICYIANVVIKMTPKKIDTDKFMNYLKLWTLCGRYSRPKAHKSNENEDY